MNREFLDELYRKLFLLKEKINDDSPIPEDEAEAFIIRRAEWCNQHQLISETINMYLDSCSS